MFQKLLVLITILSFSACSSISKNEVNYKSGTKNLKGYIAYNKDKKEKRPGILVVHEWWGHNEYARKRADMLAEMGYTAMAVDMYGDGKQADHPKTAGKFAGMVMKNDKIMSSRFNAALRLLKNHPTVDASKTAAIGYCFGGGVVLEMARRGSNMKGVVSFHGSLGHLKETPKGQIKAKMLVLNGAADPMITKEHIQNFKSNMNNAGADYKFINYKGALHAFTNPEADKLGKEFKIPVGYQKRADDESWVEMNNFLNQIF